MNKETEKVILESLRMLLCFEVIGRFGILFMIAITMNRTEWYQNLPFNSSFATLIFCFSLVLSFAWTLIPIVEFANHELSEVEDE